MIKSRRMSNAYMFYVGKTEGRRPPEKPMFRLEGKIKIDFREISWFDMD
jgi:hypothetical protein